MPPIHFTSPSSCGSLPDIMFINVVLPAPLSPTMPTCSPLFIERLAFENSGLPSYVWLKFFISSIAMILYRTQELVGKVYPVRRLAVY